MDERILMILTHMIGIDETLKLTQGQGHKVIGQGQICIYAKKWKIGKKNQRIDRYRCYLHR